ncbi:MAG: hypothetical protein IKW38_03950 [Kiritimatiellae bacterium]|nr:hypothetical protein [Kiritimatiellia bacterium]
MGLIMRWWTMFLMLFAAPFGVAETVMVEGRITPIPPITQSVTAVHLKAIGADRVYVQHFPEALIDLNLSANNLMLLPEGFIPQGIRRLWLADNRLLSLPQDASQWRNLTYLNLDRNLINALPNLSATSLRWLRCNGNHLTQVPPLPDSVERLYLADNQLREAPAKPKALRHLTLANNPLERVPDTLGCGLEELDLSGTKVSQLPADLTGWRTLRVLNLAHCPLSHEEKDRLEAFFDPLKTLLIF